jgi:hypothetical protein
VIIMALVLRGCVPVMIILTLVLRGCAHSHGYRCAECA